MAEKFSIINKNRDDLLDIFLNDKEWAESDLLSVPDCFNLLADQLDNKIVKKTGRKLCNYPVEGFGRIANAINYGFDISHSQMLVANSDHFSKDVVEGLQKGIYHIGESREVAGDFRPAILDDKERFVKSFTLKKVNNPSKILSDISTMSIQSSLRNISGQIEAVASDVKYSIDLARRVNLSDKFLNARDRIMRASKSRGKERENFFEEADRYLMEGMSSVKSDIIYQAETLANKYYLSVSVKEIDSILSYFSEDIEMMSRYAGIRIYLFNYRGKLEEAESVLSYYKSLLESLSKRNGIIKKYSAFELIHEYYSYNDDNMDFWLEKPKEMIKSIDACNLLLNQRAKEIYYIDAGVGGDE